MNVQNFLATKFDDEKIQKIKDISRLARCSLLAILVLFVVGRIVVVAIMKGWLPSFLFLHVGGHHIHHYVYGIVILSLLASWTVFLPPQSMKWKKVTAYGYGVGMALLLDELIMWLTLSASDYYAKMSIDAMIVLISLLLAVSLFHKLRRFGVDRRREYYAVLIVALALAMGAISLTGRLYSKMRPAMDQLNKQSPH